MKFSQKQVAAALALTTAFTGTAVTVSAAYHDPTTDAVLTLQELRQNRDNLRMNREALANLRAARQAVVEAQNNLRDARAAVKSAKETVKESETNVTSARQSLAEATAALQNAQMRMQEAAAAMASYQVQIQGQQAVVDDLTAQSQSIIDELTVLNNRMDELNEEMNRLNGSGYELSEDRIAAVQRALDEVGYAQNRIFEAEQLADAYTYGTDVESVQAEKEARANEISAEAEDISAQGVDASNRLDDVNAQLSGASSYLSELQSGYAAEEAAYNSAAATAQDAAKWQNDAKKWADDAEVQLKAAKENEAAAETWQSEAETALTQSEDNASKTAYDLWHIGDGTVSTRTGFVYRHWKGTHTGHQTYVPISAYTAERTDQYPGEDRVNDKDWPAGDKERRIEIGLDTGRLTSNTGGSVTSATDPDWSPGRSSGWTDTTISTRLHNDNPINSVRYGLVVVAPTGESRYYQDAYVPKGVGLFQDFGGGWQIQPEIEGIHRFTERESISGKLAYNFRGPYEFSKEVPSAEVDPGNQTIARITYNNIGEKQQWRAWLSYTYTAGTSEDRIFQKDRIWRRDGKVYFHDGPAYEVGVAVNKQIRPKDDVGVYATFGHTGRTSGGFDVPVTDEGGMLLSLHHKVNPDFSWQGFVSWYASTLGYDPLYPSQSDSEWERWGIGTRLNWKASEFDSWNFDFERYVRTQNEAPDYNGYGLSFWYTHLY